MAKQRVLTPLGKKMHRAQLRARLLARRKRWEGPILAAFKKKGVEMWCFVHGSSRGWTDKRHQVKLIRCVKVRGHWWTVVRGHVRGVGDRAPSKSEKAARAKAVKHAKEHLKWCVREMRQCKRDVARFS